MDKNKLKKLLENYKHDNQLYMEKERQIEQLKTKINSFYQRYKQLEHLKKIGKQEFDVKLKRLFTLEVECENDLIMLIENKKKIDDAIEKLSQPYRTIFYLKYICLYTFDEIAGKMHYSTKRIYQLHAEGLNQLQQILSIENRLA